MTTRYFEQITISLHIFQKIVDPIEENQSINFSEMIQDKAERGAQFFSKLQTSSGGNLQMMNGLILLQVILLVNTAVPCS